MNKPLLWTLGLLTVCAAVFAGSEKEAGAKRISIATPELTGFPDAGDSDLSGRLERDLIDIFTNYSGMRVITWGDVPEYFLKATIEKHPSQYAVKLVVEKEVEGGTGTMESLASATESAYTLDLLMYGSALNLAVKKLLTNPKLGLTLTAEARKALDKPRDTKYAERESAVAKARTASPESFKREQNSNIAKDLGQNLTEAGLQLSESTERLALPNFDTPAGFTALSFTPPAIRTFRAGATVEGIRADLARYQEHQAANKAAVEEQQQYLLRQREAILDQWQDFLGAVDKRRQLLGGEEQKLLLAQAKLESELREGEAYYRNSPPFRILYDPDPKMEIDLERETADMRFQIAAEPTSLKALKVRLDNLAELNRSFESLNKAYEEVNKAMTGRFLQVEAAMNAVKEAMDRANSAGLSLGQNYRAAPQSADWTVPSGDMVYGAALKTSWPVDYPRTFNFTVSLLVVRGENVKAIEGQTLSLSLTSDISWKGPLEPESASAWGFFKDVKIADLGEDGDLVVQIETVNGIDVETATRKGYIEIIPDGARTAAAGRRMAARESWRKYWSGSRRFNSLGLAGGTTGGLVTPAFLVSGRLTFSPFSGAFFELGSDFGLVHGERDVQDVDYLSIAPYLHVNYFAESSTPNGVGSYIGMGGGASFSQYVYPSESRLDPVTVITPVFDFNMGLFVKFSHSVFDLRWTVKTNFDGLDHRFTLGYIYRLGYFAERFGGMPAVLTNRR